MILPAAQDRSVVVFMVWPSMAYTTRLAASFVLVVAGVLVQVATGSFLWGLPALVAGNLLLLVRGYDNRVDFGKFDPGADWERADVAKLGELRRLDREIRRWDLSALDVTNPLGLVVFLLVAGLMALVAIVFPGPIRILVLDAAVLLLPHWITGVRRVLRLPGLLIKVETLDALLKAARQDVKKHRVHLLTLLRGGENPVPQDVKIKVDIEGRKPEFLGVYGQVVLNDVQGSSYPYFYVVLVAKAGFGLPDAYRAYHPPLEITAEISRQGEVEVLVIRQTTTETSGYHTEPGAAITIFREGLALAEKVAPGR